MFGIGKDKQVSKSGVDYEKLGKTMEQVLVKDYIYYMGSTKQQILGAFMRGIFTGLGTVIGATLVVTLLGLILTYLGNTIPGVGQFFTQIGEGISGGK